MKRAMIQYLYLGRVDYAEGLRLQAELVELRQRERVGNTLLLLEHPPVLTLGRNASRGNVLASDELLASRGVSLHEINRGGDVTYHGPGQLVGYPIFDLRSLRNPASGLRLGPVDFVRLMEEALIRVCGDYGVAAGRICKLTGVWCGLPAGHAGTDCAAAPQSVSGGRKICAIGIHVARGVTSHGFAFNVRTDLRDFMLINPCGITDRPVTSLEREAAEPAALPGLEAIARQTARHFGAVFEEPATELDGLAALRARAAEGADGEFPGREFQAPVFPAVDTPLQVPAAIERLQGKRERPVRA
ncbi:MAG TPA: lipoyl(octanoyl) transferase LipB [Terracidiphilus sp.]|jgi:lipoyl(octanoyl) transferase|nr:lipoyl(octanoyl) transferase LipB [Terracidiphilus sp.]